MVEAGTNSIGAHEALLRFHHLQNLARELEDWGILVQANDAIEEARSLDPQFYRAHLEAANYWLGQLTPTNRFYGVTDLRYQQRETNAVAALRAAETTAPDQLSRLKTERTRAQLEVRLRDAVALASGSWRSRPAVRSGNSWESSPRRSAATTWRARPSTRPGRGRTR
jgi:hypothetical protein